MELKQVDSSNINAIGYDTTENILFIQFKNGSIYRYFEVPFDVYETFISSQSKGTYFNKIIRNKFESEKIEIINKQT